MAFAILFDSTKCVGCRSCEGACAEKWQKPYDEKIAAEEKLSAHKLTAVVTKGERYVRRLCMHCVEPACVSACPVGALEKTAQGPVVYDAAKCMGCRYCMTACAFTAPSFDWNSRLPQIHKCNLCIERQSAGKPTACTEACPTEATVCGGREAMIALARQRMAENPSGYYPHIYGLEEVGGTNVLMISDVPLQSLGLPGNLPTGPLPALTWRALETIPSVVTVGSILLSGIYWFTHRRQAVAEAEGRESR